MGDSNRLETIPYHFLCSGRELRALDERLELSTHDGRWRRERLLWNLLRVLCGEQRNVLSHLPKKLHPSVGKTLRDAYRSKSKTTAKRRLLQLATQLSADHPDAASSLKEGLDETLSLKGVGLPDWLERTLSSTNSIENVNGRMRAILRKVKRWRDGSMIKRWVATALLETERGFRNADFARCAATRECPPS